MPIGKGSHACRRHALKSQQGAQKISAPPPFGLGAFGPNLHSLPGSSSQEERFTHIVIEAWWKEFIYSNWKECSLMHWVDGTSWRLHGTWSYPTSESTMLCSATGVGVPVKISTPPDSGRRVPAPRQIYVGPSRLSSCTAPPPIYSQPLPVNTQPLLSPLGRRDIFLLPVQCQEPHSSNFSTRLLR